MPGERLTCKTNDTAHGNVSMLAIWPSGQSTTKFCNYHEPPRRIPQETAPSSSATAVKSDLARLGIRLECARIWRIVDN